MSPATNRDLKRITIRRLQAFVKTFADEEIVHYLVAPLTTLRKPRKFWYPIAGVQADVGQLGEK